MTGLILHAYDASPFTQRALRILGIKDLDWRWVETPMTPPKDDLLALTGGYRGTPVLQIGGDVYIDSQLIALELERRHPEPSLFPARNVGIALALVKWSDAFFRSGLKILLAMCSDSWPEEFRKDREFLFPDIDFARVGGELSHARAQFRAHAWLLEQQLADGRAFLGGAVSHAFFCPRAREGSGLARLDVAAGRSACSRARALTHTSHEAGILIDATKN